MGSVRPFPRHVISVSAHHLAQAPPARVSQKLGSDLTPQVLLRDLEKEADVGDEGWGNSPYVRVL